MYGMCRGKELREGATINGRDHEGLCHSEVRWMGLPMKLLNVLDFTPSSIPTMSGYTSIEE